MEGGEGKAGGVDGGLANKIIVKSAAQISCGRLAGPGRKLVFIFPDPVYHTVLPPCLLAGFTSSRECRTDTCLQGETGMRKKVL